MLGWQSHHKKLYCGLFLTLALALALPLAAHATIFNLTASLDGTQAGTMSSATGFATVTLDDIMNTLNWDLSFSGLLSTTTAAHFHAPAPPGVNAPIIVPLSPFPLGVTSGTSMGSASVTATEEAEILAGLSYINIHTTLFPAGEIRGQVLPLPVPGSLLLLASGLAGLFGLKRQWLFKKP